MPGNAAATEASTDPLMQVLVDAVARGSVILAPTERAARDLRNRFALLQSSADHPTWTPARILTWSSWTSSLWSILITTGVEPRLLLNAAQEHALWRDVIQTGPALESLGSIDSLADLATCAWSLAADYEALQRISRSASTHDARTFAAWASVFRTHCDSRQYLSAAELTTALRTHIERNTLAAPAHLLLIGFENDAPPSRSRLLEALAKAGCNIKHHTPTTASSAPQVVRCETPADEALTAARWIRNFIETRTSAGESVRVALIVPQLEDERPKLEATLREVLAPELQHIDADLSAGPIAFSSGPPLAESTLIATALDLIHWLTGPLDQHRITALLLSPYIGHTADLPARAEFDAFHLRKSQRLRPELTLTQFLRIAAQKLGAPSSRGLIALGWAAQIQSLAQFATQLTPTTQRPHADWMELIRSALREANWPGDRPLTAQEFNAARVWEHVLDSVATLDFAGTRVPFTAALQALDRQARAATSTPTQTGAAVQVIRPTEAAGTTFDAVVFLHATDALWPAPARTNPLLSWSLQRELNMPGANPSLSSERAAEVTAGLITSTPNILFFYPATSETGEQRLSPIVAALNLPHITAVELLPPATPPAPLPTEVFADTAPLPPLPSTRVSGGARVLRLQAACAFLAAAELRLRSTPPPASTIGVDNLESGNFLHRAMQAVWNDLKSQKDLRNKTPDELNTIIQRSVRGAVNVSIDSQSTWDKAYIEVLRERLAALIRNWLRHELQRGPFEVLRMEEDTEVTVGPLTLRVRMDRVDQVEGGHVFVDYKTGSAARHTQWDGARPEEPQLPLYALLSQPGELKGIAFARIRAGEEMSWVGRQSEAGILPSKRIDDIDHAIDEWRATLAALAEDFAAGRSSISPRNIAIDCAHCAQRLLCRIDPELFATQSVADDPAEDAV